MKLLNLPMLDTSAQAWFWGSEDLGMRYGHRFDPQQARKTLSFLWLAFPQGGKASQRKDDVVHVMFLHMVRQIRHCAAANA